MIEIIRSIKIRYESHSVCEKVQSDFMGKRELNLERKVKESISKGDLYMKKYQFTALIWEEDGVYVSKCVEIEVASCGDTPKEALENLREAIDLWLKNAEYLLLLSDIEPSLISAEKFTSVIEVEAT